MEERVWRTEKKKRKKGEKKRREGKENMERK